MRVLHVQERGVVQKRLTIALDEQVYKCLRKVIGPRRISRFIEDLVRPHVLLKDPEAGYRAMAQDEEHEAEALDWAEALIEDVADAGR